MKNGFTVPAGGGRSVLVRPGDEGECVQFAILSVNQNIIEAVTFDRAQLPAMVGALRGSQAAADRDLMGALTRRQREAEQRYTDALARNPWQQEPVEKRERRGLR